MKVLLSWIREFVDVHEPAEAIGRLLSNRGLALEGLEPDGDDAVLDFEVTSNRPDCLSIRGIAREIATAYRLPFKDCVVPREGLEAVLNGPSGLTIPVTIDEPDLCGRYVGIVAEVAATGPSPDWMQKRLLACGVRPISSVVDVTNYVLLEAGQPMHAFDHAKLAGPAIVVRRARAGERLTTLDGKPRALTTDMLVIADGQRPQAIGGVMGGADSEVSAATRRIVFEAAHFNPNSIRATSRTLGLKTEASIRFERGVDATIASFAALRACELLASIGAGKAQGTLTDICPRRPEPADLMLPRASVSGLLGMDVPDQEVMRILESLGFDVEPSGDGWSVTVPSWRMDVRRKEDLIEEVGRHYGFEHLPVTFPPVVKAPPPSDPRIARDGRVRRALQAMGFSEAITFAFIEEGAAAPFSSGAGPVMLANPLTEKFAVMRPSLLPGLVDSVSHNRRHGRKDVRLFEVGTRFSTSGETRAAAVAWTGLATPEHWSGGRRAVDFFDVKGVSERIAELMGVSPSFDPAAPAHLVEGRRATMLVAGKPVGILGELVPDIAAARDLPAGEAVYVAELDLDALAAAAPGATRLTTPLPRFPAVVRDLAILVDDVLSAERVRGTIWSAAPATLVQLAEFDRYQGKGIPEGKVSLALRLTFQSKDRTLTDDEVQAAMQRIVDALARTLNAVQR